MSKTNKHRINWINSPSIQFMRDELGPHKPCPKRSCKGTCVEVLVRYVDHGTINREYECTTCGKVIKDPLFRKEREERWKQSKRKRQKQKRKGEKNATNARSSRF